MRGKKMNLTEEELKDFDLVEYGDKVPISDFHRVMEDRDFFEGPEYIEDENGKIWMLAKKK
jgi:hypothetical protein